MPEIWNIFILIFHILSHIRYSIRQWNICKKNHSPLNVHISNVLLIKLSFVNKAKFYRIDTFNRHETSILRGIENCLRIQCVPLSMEIQYIFNVQMRTETRWVSLWKMDSRHESWIKTFQCVLKHKENFLSSKRRTALFGIVWRRENFNWIKPRMKDDHWNGCAECREIELLSSLCFYGWMIFAKHLFREMFFDLEIVPLSDNVHIVTSHLNFIHETN